MPTLRDYFLNESKEYLGQLNDQVNRLNSSTGNPAELHRIVKLLRGSAQLARETRVYQASLALETAARELMNGAITWDVDLGGRVGRTVEDIEALAKGGEDSDAAEARMRRVLDRWREAGVRMPEAAVQSAPASGERSAASQQFREFAAHEVAGITTEIETSLTQLAQDPRNRDALKAILRRQRALLGSARLDEIGVVAETLRAIEDLVRVIAKLNVAVKEEWMAVFRASRDVLSAALEPLKVGKDPVPSPALSKLRTLRSELLERYGDGAAVSVTDAPPPAFTSAPSGASQASPTSPSANAQTSTPSSSAASAAAASIPAGEGVVVPIESLCFSGERALRMALDLRTRMEELVGNDAGARESVEELFDLVRLGIG